MWRVRQARLCLWSHRMPLILAHAPRATNSGPRGDTNSGRLHSQHFEPRASGEYTHAQALPEGSPLGRSLTLKPDRPRQPVGMEKPQTYTPSLPHQPHMEEL